MWKGEVPVEEFLSVGNAAAYDDLLPDAKEVFEIHQLFVIYWKPMLLGGWGGPMPLGGWGGPIALMVFPFTIHPPLSLTHSYSS